MSEHLHMKGNPDGHSLLIFRQLLSALDHSQIEKLIFIDSLVNEVSLLACFFNLLSMIAFRNFHQALGRMMIALCIMDMLYNASSLLSAKSLSVYIFPQALKFARFFGYIGSITWTACFAHALLRIRKQGDPKFMEPLFRNYTIFCFSSAFIISILAVVSDSSIMDPVQELSDIPDIQSGWYWGGLVLFATPSLLISGYSFYSYAITFRELKTSEGRFHYELFFYPMILILCNFPLISLGLYLELVPDGSIPLGYGVACYALFNSQGLFNAFAYGLQGFVTSCRKCCRRRNVESDHLAASLSFNSAPITQSGSSNDPLRIST